MKKNTSVRKYVMLLFAFVLIALPFIGCDGGIASTGDGSSVVPLGSAGSFVILAKTMITNTGTTAVTGDLGLSPAATSEITGFALVGAGDHATSALVTGNVYASDMTAPTPINLTTAIGDMQTAYTNAAGRSNPKALNLKSGLIGGETLTPGLYKWGSSVSINDSDLTLTGSATDTWIFQISGNLTMASGKKVILAGGALPKNIVWQVAGIATLGTGSHMEGIILSQTQIILQTGSSINGRLLAQSQVTLDASVVVKPAP